MTPSSGNPHGFPFQPAPFSARSGRGVPASRLGVVTSDSSTGVKPNMCVAPATNGERAFGKVEASQPLSAKKQFKTSPSY